MRLAFRQTHLYRFVNMEVTPGFEPGNEGFADPCLTTWLCHRTVSPLVSILYEAAFVKRETVFPAAFLLLASTDGGDKDLLRGKKRRPAGRRLHLFCIRQDAQQHQLIRAGVVDAVGVSLRAVVGHARGDGHVRAVVVAYAAAG